MRIFLSIIVSCLLATQALAVDGWENLRWGMSEKQVMAAYPAAVRTIDSEPYTTLRLKSHFMGGYNFWVLFFFDKEKRLRGASMVQDSVPAENDLRMEDLTRVLTERHGKPTKGKGTGEDGKMVWSGEKSTISLYGNKSGTVFLIYAPELKAEREPDPE